MTKVIIFKEPSRDYIYDASTDEAILKACLVVFNRRWFDPRTYYFREPHLFEPTEKELEYINLADDDLTHIPAVAYESIVEKRNKLLHKKKLHEKMHEDYELWVKEGTTLLSLPIESQLVRTINFLPNVEGQPEPLSVLWLLKQRSRLHGEGFNIVELDVI
jgi:hypothetical protein